MNGRRLLVIAQNPPTPDRDSGSIRLRDLINAFRADRWVPTFAACKGTPEVRYARALQRAGVAVYDCSHAGLDDLLRNGGYDLALISSWAVAELCLPVVRRLSPQTRILVDSVDLHFIRNARRLLGSRSRSNSAGRVDAAFGAELVRELNAYAAADRVLTASCKEAEWISTLIPELGFAQWMPDVEEPVESPIPGPERSGIVFVGSFRHAPNVSAAEFLCREVAPRIAPELIQNHPIYILGESPDERVRQLAADQPNIRITGWVPSALPYVERSRVCVVPLLFGAGTKRKLLQSLMVGTPVVSTPIGIEGFDLSDEDHVLVAEDPKAFASAIERLLTDDGLWSRLARQGRAHVCAAHSREALQHRLRTVVRGVMSAEPRPLEPGFPAVSESSGSTRLDLQQYAELRSAIRKAVDSSVPRGATVIVVSKGDGDLLNLNGRQGWHCPQASGGTYAGHHPADSAEAIEQISGLRARGGTHLLIPATMAWWLDFYPGLAHYLSRHAREVLRENGVCLIYEFVPVSESSSSALMSAARSGQPPRRVSDDFAPEENRVCAVLTVADWDTLRQWRECVESHAAYCRKFGHKWHVVSAPLSAKPGLSWNDWSWQKIYSLSQLLWRLPDGAYVLVVDADVLIAANSPDWTREPWCNGAGSTPFVYLARGHSGRFNAGVQMVRNCPEARSFLSALLHVHRAPQIPPSGYPAVPEELRSFFLAENGPLIHLTNCRPEVVREIPSKWNNTIDPKIPDHFRHFTGPMKREFRSIAGRRPAALLVLNTPWHFECIAPWIYYLVQLGFCVHIDMLHIGNDPEHIRLLRGLRYAGPFTEHVSVFESYTTSEDKWAQRFLRMKRKPDCPESGYSLIAVLSHYAYWERPFLPPDAEVVATRLKAASLSSLPILLYCHTTQAVDRPNTLVRVSGSAPGAPLSYIPCCTTKHGFEALRRLPNAANLPATWFVPLYANLWTSPLAGDCSRWKERQTVRFVIQGRLAPGHRAYRRLAQALDALGPRTRSKVKFTIIGFGDRDKLFEELRKGGLPKDGDCVEILSNLGTAAFDQQLGECHFLFDCLDETVMGREQYLVDRLTSTVTRALPLSRPVLCHESIRNTYGIPSQACESYTDEPRSLAKAIARMVAYSDADYAERCSVMRDFCLRIHEKNLDNLASLLAGRIQNLRSMASAVAPVADALHITDSESVEPSFDRPEDGHLSERRHASSVSTAPSGAFAVIATSQPVPSRVEN